MKLGRALLCVALAGFCACRKSEAGKPAAQKPAPPPPPRVKIVTDRISLADLDRMRLDEAVRARRDVFRVRPDRRFLIALGELDLLVAGKPRTDLHLAWNGSVWRIDAGGTPAGEVPEVASYAELRAVLSQRARALAGDRAPAPSAAGSLDAIRADVEAFDAGKQIQALQSIDRMWPAAGLPDPELASLAAGAAVAVSVQSLDTLEIADLLRARALALLALTEALGQPRRGDEVILAASLGYRPDARRMAHALPANDPSRLYAEERTPILVEAASQKGADGRTRYLALLSLGEKRDPAAWSEFQDTRFAGEGFRQPVIRTAAALESFEVDVTLGRAAIYSAFRELGGPPKEGASPPAEIRDDQGPVAAAVARFVAETQKRQGVRPAGLVREFEGRLAPASAVSTGRLWDAHAMQAWHRGGFYSGLHRVGQRYLDELASPDGARELAAYLEGSPEGIASQYSRWYGDLSAELSGSADWNRQYDDLLGLPSLGGPALRRMARNLFGKDYQGRFPGDVLPERLAVRLDARPDNVAFMNLIAFYGIADLPWYEDSCKIWLKQGWKDEVGTTGRCLRFTNDRDAIASLIRDRSVDLAIRAELLGAYAAMPGAPEAFCRASFRALGEEGRYERIVTVPWLTWIELQRKDYAEAQRVVEGYLAHHDEGTGLMWVVYRGRLAHLISLQGRDREAWKIIEPLISSGQGAVMAWGAEILDRLGRTDEAYELASHAVERYPDSQESRMDLAVHLWKRQRFSEAALAIDPPPENYKVNDRNFRDTLAPRFVEVFEKQPDASVETAVRAMLDQGVKPQTIRYLLPPLASAGRGDLAFRLQSSFSPKHRHVWDIAAWQLQGFELLEKGKGRPEAIAWIRGAIPPPQREPSLESFFNNKAWGLVWDAVPPEEEPRLSEWVWLLRTGAVVVDPNVAKAHRAELLARYAEPAPADAQRTIARHLLGLESRDAVLAAASKPDERCKAAYFFGLQDVLAGRYAQASEWMSLVNASCIQTSWRVNTFALFVLDRWRDFGQDLDVAAAQKVW